jgi:hypothetical protein
MLFRSSLLLINSYNKIKETTQAAKEKMGLAEKPGIVEKTKKVFFHLFNKEKI